MKGNSAISALAVLLCLKMASAQSDLVASSLVAKANTDFASNFYSAVKSISPNQNLIFSPYSLSSCVALVKAGARGQTATEIQTGMLFPDDDILFRGYKSQLGELKSNENYTLEVANSVYPKIGFKLNPSYEAIVRNSFGANVQQLDFNDGTGSAKTINGFVERVTNNRIKDLISSGDLNQDTRLVLVNAIYFKGFWKSKFDIKLTTIEKFHVAPGKEVNVNMMKIMENFPYGEFPELDAKVIQLPYKGDRLSMIVILPNQQDGLANLESKLKSVNLGTIYTRLFERKVQLSMPRFKLESEIDLKAPLEMLGMKSMFSERNADLSGIPDERNSQPLYVSKAVQKTFLKVDEEGSEAAAATAVTIMLKSSLVPRMVNMTLNHPFIAIIQNSQLAPQFQFGQVQQSFGDQQPAIDVNILFMSTVVNPTTIDSSNRNDAVNFKNSFLIIPLIMLMSFILC